MFENRIKRGEISSAQIVDELSQQNFNMHGVERHRFFVDSLGMTVIRSYPIGRDAILIFKKKDWREKRRMIVGKNRNGYPILQGQTQVITATHDRKVARPEAEPTAEDRSTVEKKLDLLLWSVDELLKLQAKYA